MAEEQEAVATDAEEVDLDAIVNKWGEKLFEEEGESAEAKTGAEGESQDEQSETKEEGQEGQQEESKDDQSVQAEGSSAEDKEGEKTPEEKPRAKALAALAKKEQELRDKEKQLKEQAEKHSKFENMEREFAASPIEFLKKLGVTDFAGMANQLWYHELGEDAPEDFKQRAAQTSMETRLKALEAREERLKQEAEEAKQQAAYQAEVAAVDRDIQAFVRDVPNNLPYLARLAGDSVQQAYQAMCQVAAAAIEAGNRPSARELGKLLNDQFEADFKYWKGINSEATQKTPENKRVDTRQSPKTLASADTAQRPSRESEGLLSDEEYQERAIRSAEKFGLFKQ